MKSTLRIDYQSGSHGSDPIIKIVQPVEVLESLVEPDYDVRDRLIRDLLQRPGYSDRNYWFQLDTYYPNDMEKPTAHISNIIAVRQEDLFYKFRHAILNRMVCYNELVETNHAISNKKPDQEIKLGENFKKITEFFDWLDTATWPSYEEQNPYEGIKVPRSPL